MAARGCCLPPSNLPQTQFSVHHTKNDVLPARGNFPRVRELFLTQQLGNSKNFESCCTNDPRNSINQPLSELTFDRLQPTVEECAGMQIRKFGSFVAREAILDEEYWAAAWLRAEAHWEYASCMRHVDSCKKQYAEQEFNALKRRCFRQDGNSLKCFCIVAVKKEDPRIRRTVLKSIVGTLDLSIRQFLHGETYPEEVNRRYSVFASQEPFDTHKYAYIANVCVSKFARRKGTASNMLFLARDIAMKEGLKKIYVHVNANNTAARHLYEKTGFKVVDAASGRSSKDQLILMSMDI